MNALETSLLAAVVSGFVIVSCTAPETSSIVRGCPVLKTYTAAQQQKLADEMSALPAGAALRAAMADYLDLRNQVRACRG